MASQKVKVRVEEDWQVTARRLKPSLYPRPERRRERLGRCSSCGLSHGGVSYGPVRFDPVSGMPEYYGSQTQGTQVYLFEDESTVYCTTCVYRRVVEYRAQAKERAKEEVRLQRRQAFYDSVFGSRT